MTSSVLYPRISPQPVTTQHPPLVSHISNDEQTDNNYTVEYQYDTVSPSASGNVLGLNMVSSNFANFNEPQQSTSKGSPLLSGSLHSSSQQSASNVRNLTTEQVRPYPKAQLRKKSNQGRKRGKHAFLQILLKKKG